MTASAIEEEQQHELDPRLAPGATFGAYKLGRLIGAGGMSSVHEGVHVALQKRVAIKILHANLAANEPLRARFVREGEATSRIRHPNVVNVSDVGTHEGLPYLVMDMLDGESLQQVLDIHRTLDERTLANVIVPVIAGLGAAHGAGVLHRDLKPDNIVLAREADGTIVPKLIDFGVSKLLDVSHGTTAAGSVLGTPHYMAPEVILQRNDVDPRADQYAVGVLLYECLCGQVPFDAGSLFELMNLIVSGVYVKPSVLRPGLTQELETIVIRAMQTEPSARFPSLKVLGAALLPFASTRTRFQYGPSFGVMDSMDPLDDELVNTGQFAISQLISQKGDPHGVTRAFVAPRVQIDTRLPPMAPMPDGPPTRTPTGKSALVLLVLGALASVALGAYFAFGLPDEEADVVVEAPAPAPAPSTFTVTITPTPSDAYVEIDGEQMARGAFRGVMPVDGRTHRLRVHAEGYAPITSVFRDVPPDEHVVLERLPTSTTTPSVEPTRDTAMRTSERRPRGEPDAPATTMQPASDLDIRFER